MLSKPLCCSRLPENTQTLVADDPWRQWDMREAARAKQMTEALADCDVFTSGTVPALAPFIRILNPSLDGMTLLNAPHRTFATFASRRARCALEFLDPDRGHTRATIPFTTVVWL
jgi:hypothetical protein